MAEVGDIRIAAYRSGGFISADSGYAPTLRGLGADGNGEVLVATVPPPIRCGPTSDPPGEPASG